jgi:hypothetical protein
VNTICLGLPCITATSRLASIPKACRFANPVPGGYPENPAAPTRCAGNQVVGVGRVYQDLLVLVAATPLPRPRPSFTGHDGGLRVSMRGPTTPGTSMTHADADSTGAMCGCPIRSHLPRRLRSRPTQPHTNRFKVEIPPGEDERTLLLFPAQEVSPWIVWKIASTGVGVARRLWDQREQLRGEYEDVDGTDRALWPI